MCSSVALAFVFSARFLGSVLGALPLLATSGAVAEAVRTGEAEPERVSLSYQAPAQCPSAAEFMDRVVLRANVEWNAEQGASVRHVDVRIESTGSMFAAHVQYVDVDDNRISRSVEAPNCDQAVSAIALVFALTIEEHATVSAEPAEPKRVERKPAPHPAPSPRSRNTSVAAPTPLPRALGQEFGALAAVAYGIGPGAALGVGAWWGIGRAPVPFLRVIGRWHEYDYRPTAAPGIEARFRAISLAPEACVGQRLGWLGGTIGALCGGFDVGEYRAQAVSQRASQYRVLSNSLLWASVEVSALLRLQSGAVFVQAQPMVRFPFVSGQFGIADGAAQQTVIHRIPRVAGGLDVGFGLSFL